MKHYERVKGLIPKYGPLDDPFKAIDNRVGSCAAFALSVVAPEVAPLVVRISSKKHNSGLVTSHYAAVNATDVNATDGVVCDMTANGPRCITFKHLQVPHRNYELARDRLLRLAVADHLLSDENKIAGEQEIEDERTGYVTTLRVARINPSVMLQEVAPGKTLAELAERVEEYVV